MIIAADHGERHSLTFNAVSTALSGGQLIEHKTRRGRSIDPMTIKPQPRLKRAQGFEQ